MSFVLLQLCHVAAAAAAHSGAPVEPVPWQFPKGVPVSTGAAAHPLGEFLLLSLPFRFPNWAFPLLSPKGTSTKSITLWKNKTKQNFSLQSKSFYTNTFNCTFPGALGRSLTLKKYNSETYTGTYFASAFWTLFQNANALIWSFLGFGHRHESTLNSFFSQTGKFLKGISSSQETFTLFFSSSRWTSSACWILIFVFLEEIRRKPVVFWLWKDSLDSWEKNSRGKIKCSAYWRTIHFQWQV